MLRASIQYFKSSVSISVFNWWKNLTAKLQRNLLLSFLEFLHYKIFLSSYITKLHKRNQSQNLIDGKSKKRKGVSRIVRWTINIWVLVWANCQLCWFNFCNMNQSFRSSILLTSSYDLYSEKFKLVIISPCIFRKWNASTPIFFLIGLKTYFLCWTES